MFRARRLLLVRSRTVRMINFGMGKIVDEIWFDPKTNRNIFKTVIV